MRTFLRFFFVLFMLFSVSHVFSHDLFPVRDAHAQISGKKPGTPAPLPEPATIILLVTGLAGIGVYRLVSRKKSGKP